MSRLGSDDRRMESIENHYAQLLGLQTPWEVVEVELQLEAKRVEINLEHPLGVKVSCPECDRDCTIADHAPQRKWRHLDTMGFTTELITKTPRASCDNCGVKTIAVPWAGKGSRFTLMFEAFAIEVIKACGNVTKAGDLLRLGWDAVQRIIERAVERGLARREEETITYVGMDEKSFRKGHNYISLLNDLNSSRVLEVAEGRKEENSDSLWDSLSEEMRSKVKAVAIDMWPAYINSAAKNAPNADIVHDRYHISGHLNKAVDQIRRKENRELVADGDTMLKGTKYLWLFNVENLTEPRWMKFENLLAADLKTGEAWMLKETMRRFWEYKHAGNARKFFEKWYSKVIGTGETAMVKAAEMLKSHLPNILTYFKHRITNAVSEGLNSKIQSIKAMARGFRTFENYRTRILFFCGKLDLSISPSTH